MKLTVDLIGVTELTTNVTSCEAISKVVKKEIIVNGVKIKVIKTNSSAKDLLEAGIISESDIEMDYRARTAVRLVYIDMTSNQAKKEDSVYGVAYVFDKTAKINRTIKSVSERCGAQVNKRRIKAISLRNWCVDKKWKTQKTYL